MKRAKLVICPEIITLRTYALTSILGPSVGADRNQYGSVKGRIYRLLVESRPGLRSLSPSKQKLNLTLVADNSLSYRSHGKYLGGAVTLRHRDILLRRPVAGEDHHAS